jgi:hypothetical protein
MSILRRKGDDLTSLNTRSTIIKKIKGSSDGVLRHLKGDVKYSDRNSLQDAMARKYEAPNANNAKYEHSTVLVINQLAKFNHLG